MTSRPTRATSSSARRRERIIRPVWRSGSFCARPAAAVEAEADDGFAGGRASSSCEESEPEEVEEVEEEEDDDDDMPGRR